ncbi:GNAT family N-acetyltransferase [Devosia sp. WQ 349]|uniref:GNAT family N-acetyltransferase n=1 Tax=Devosia sp. WQ 349K1 TaxID=2800329 RepID=UPI001905F773|nr:GNAT family N-acetyltransferase [Devosia sp. WQ 349K1]MBK1793808.1 GNAT family N-acetyltransferase [Devosia sp. WQ 349K1]
MKSAAPYLRLRKALIAPLPAPIWPTGLVKATLSHVPPEAVHKLLKATFRDIAKPCSAWYAALSTDEEYDPALAILALGPDGTVAGYIQSWTSGFVKDLVVAPEHRRQNIGTLLMAETFALFAARGLSHVDLKVERKNKPAQKFYAGLGMIEVLD